MPIPESTGPRLRTWGEALMVYLTPRQLIILVMGFSSGLPLLLTLSTLTYWLSTANVDKTTIGLFTIVQTPYAYKFLWSPIVDRLRLPVPGLVQLDLELALDPLAVVPGRAAVPDQDQVARGAHRSPATSAPSSIVGQSRHSRSRA